LYRGFAILSVITFQSRAFDAAWKESASKQNGGTITLEEPSCRGCTISLSEEEPVALTDCL